MDRPKVNIFVETTYRGPARKDGAGVWIVEYKKRNGVPVTRGGKVRLENATENQTTLAALAEALGVLAKPCSVRVNTRCGHVLNAFKNGWPKRWEKSGWINAKGRPVGNAKEWRQVMEALKIHTYAFQDGPHEYQAVMLWDLERDKEA